MLEKIADVLAGISILLGLAFGGVAAYEHDGILGIGGAACLAIGYGAVRIGEAERRDKKFEVEIGGEDSA